MVEGALDIECLAFGKLWAFGEFLAFGILGNAQGGSIERTEASADITALGAACVWAGDRTLSLGVCLFFF